MDHLTKSASKLEFSTAKPPIPTLTTSRIPSKWQFQMRAVPAPPWKRLKGRAHRVIKLMSSLRAVTMRRSKRSLSLPKWRTRTWSSTRQTSALTTKVKLSIWLHLSTLSMKTSTRQICLLLSPRPRRWLPSSHTRVNSQERTRSLTWIHKLWISAAMRSVDLQYSRRVSSTLKASQPFAVVLISKAWTRIKSPYRQSTGPQILLTWSIRPWLR